MTAGAQLAGKVYRIGILGNKAADADEMLTWQIFRDGLREHGWSEGGNIRIEYRWVEDSTARVSEVAAELVRLRPDLLVTRGSFLTQALKTATSSIPIVFLNHADPVGTGHVSSLARPGGNITGTALIQTEIGAKDLELLHTVVPTADRIAVLWHTSTPSAVPGLKALEAPARRLRVQLQPVGAGSEADLQSAFQTMTREGAKAVLVFNTVPLIPARQRLAELAIRHRLPAMFQGRHYVEAGGLMSYYPKREDAWRGASGHVDKILRGAKPGDLPVEQAATFELVINTRAAKAIGLTIPPSVLQRADQLID